MRLQLPGHAAWPAQGVGPAQGNDPTKAIVDGPWQTARRPPGRASAVCSRFHSSVERPCRRDRRAWGFARSAEPADEDLLLAAIVEKTSREEPPLATAGATAAVMSATELQKAAAAISRVTASEHFQLRLAKRCLDPNSPPVDRAVDRVPEGAAAGKPCCPSPAVYRGRIGTAGGGEVPAVLPAMQRAGIGQPVGPSRGTRSTVDCFSSAGRRPGIGGPRALDRVVLQGARPTPGGRLVRWAIRRVW